METPGYTESVRTITGGVIRPGGFSITDRGIGLCNVSSQDRILDAGCGTGATIRHLRDQYDATGYGLDLSGPFLYEARAECRDTPLIRGSLESLPFRNEVFEGIVCECVLSHTFAALVLREFSRVLKVDGFLILSDLYRKRATGMPIPEALTGMRLIEKARIVTYLADLHFRIIDWEDRSADLKKLAVSIVMSRDSSLIACGRDGKTICAEKMLETWMGIGYYLLVARKDNI